MKPPQLFGYETYFSLLRNFSDLMMTTGKHFLKVQHVVDLYSPDQKGVLWNEEGY